VVTCVVCALVQLHPRVKEVRQSLKYTAGDPYIGTAMGGLALCIGCNPYIGTSIAGLALCIGSYPYIGTTIDGLALCIGV
jgi:hypothetical protein